MALGELSRTIEDNQVVQTSYARCAILSSEPTQCPLCKVDVPAWTRHECSQPEQTK